MASNRTREKSESPTLAEAQHWFNKSGYPLEMRTAHVVERAGFAGMPNVHVPVEDRRPVEIDVLAGRAAAATGLLRKAVFHFSIECKGHPEGFVVFGRKRQPEDAARNVLATTGVRAALEILADRAPHALVNLPADALASTATSTRGTHAIDGLSSACEKAAALIEQHERETDPPFVTIVVPLLVWRGPLFRGWLDENNATPLEEISSAIVSWDGYDAGVPTDVFVVRDGFLEDWLRSTIPAVDHVLRLLADTMPSLMREIDAPGMKQQPRNVQRLAFRRHQTQMNRLRDGLAAGWSATVEASTFAHLLRRE